MGKSHLVNKIFPNHSISNPTPYHSYATLLSTPMALVTTEQTVYLLVYLLSAFSSP